MHKKTIQIIIVLGIVALLLLIAVQFFWAKNTIALEEKQFNHKVKIALSNAGYKLRLIQHQTISSIHPVKQITPNQFIVEIQDIIDPIAVDSILHKEFVELEMDLPYKIAIYDCFTDSVVYSVRGSQLQEKISAEESGVIWDVNSYNFGVLFSDSSKFRSYLNIFGVAILLVFIVFLLLSYVIYLLIHQKKLDDIKNDFINNMTHELKTPISTISLSANMLCNPKAAENPERFLRYANIIKDENNRLKNQVERVLQIAFLENENLNLDIQNINIKTIIEKAILPYQINIEKLEGSIEILGDDVVFVGDEHHLIHVFSNLIDNAIKYTIQKPKISIHIHKNFNQLEVSVKDNGIGMNVEQIKNIFKKFYRVPTGNLHDVKGFGIGLNYVKLMVEKHNGEILVESKLGEGTTFKILLPVA